MFRKTKNKNKKWFCKNCLQYFSSENVLMRHKEDCLSINGVQSIKVKEGTIEFENYFKQIPVPFKIYADFECNLESAEVYEGSYSKKYHDHVPYSFAYAVVSIDDRFSKPIVVFRGENVAYEFIKVIFKEYKYCKKAIKKHFNKNLNKNLFQQSNSCWICQNLLIMTMKKLEIIVTLLENLEVQPIGTVT